MRFATVLAVLMLTLSVSGFGDIVDPDPVNFCPLGTTLDAANSKCTVGTGLAKETIAVGTTGFDMYKNGNGGGANSSNPWYLLLAVPNGSGAPTITSTSFSTPTPAPPHWDAGQFTKETSGSIYQFASEKLGISMVGDASMRASNLFCDGKNFPACTTSNEIEAFGSLPGYFEIYVYPFQPDFHNWTVYSFSSSGLTPGSYLAGSGGSKCFSTPFTTTGLVHSTPDGGVALMLLGGALVGFEALRRRLRI